MGVLPAFQSKGVGTRLKLAQREQMLRQGIDLIVWTYDPLEGPNAMLNIEKLGGFVRTYVREIYGRMVENPLQAGLAMDRFMLEWHLLNDRVRGRIAGNYERSNVRDWLENKKYRLVNFANWNSDLPRPIAADLEMDEHVLLVQVPANIHAIRRRDLSVARGWRKNTREIFETYFRRGYVITGFATEMEPNAPNIYKMENVAFPAPIDFSLWATGIDDSTNDSEDEED
jgi:predicted GNAT superfamily acetyltransferase